MKDFKVLNFATVIPEAISNFSDLDAMGFVGEKMLTYAELGEKISAVQAFLEANNVKPGEKVILLSQNMPNWGAVYFALQIMGIIAVPVLPDFNPHEIENVLNHSEAETIFISENLEFKIKDINNENLKFVVRMDNFHILKSTDKAVAFNPEGRSSNTYQPDENDLAILIYTSGTTGDSKGVMLSQKNVLINAIQGGDTQKIKPKERFLSVLPLSHTYENTLGLILPVMSGANITYLRKPPTASVLVPAMQKVKPQYMLTVPMIIEKVFRNKVLPGIQAKPITKALYKFKPTRSLLHKIAGKKLYETFGGELKFFGIGGAKLDGVVEQFLRDAKFPYAIGYGLTETAPMLAGSNPQMTKLQAIGPAALYCEIKINNPDPVTGEGEIWGRGPNVMLGYYKNEAKTKEVLTDDGWFKTGDLGVFDKDGWLSHRGRLKNMIVGANGENIYPEDIESLINNFKHVVESIVIEKKGRLVAMVHFNREEMEQRIKEMTSEISQIVDERKKEIRQMVDEAIEELSKELKAHINARVNKFSKIQDLIIHADPFQRTATQKIKRFLYA